MRKQEFIDALYKAGWDAPHDAQHAQIEELWKIIFPAVAKIESELVDMVEAAHMAGQADAGVDPGYSNAQAYCRDVFDG